MKWVVGGFVLWVILRGRLPLYANIVTGSLDTANNAGAEIGKIVGGLLPMPLVKP